MTKTDAGHLLALHLSAADITSTWRVLTAQEGVEPLYYNQAIYTDKVCAEGLLRHNQTLLAFFFVTKRNDSGSLVIMKQRFEAADKQQLRGILRLRSESLHNTRGMLTCDFLRARSDRGL
ncbi:MULTISPECIES: hypothetical protein [unclassified Serratia (in: enterobacteria)]